jgi:FtsZ-interacting cell division protein ZipA
MDHHQLTVIVAVGAIVVVLVAVGLLLMRKKRSQMLRERFGPEYDRVVKREGNVQRAEDVLQIRTDRRKKFQIVPLSSSTRADFVRRWTAVQTQFVDDPKGAVSSADLLVNEVMRARGYPIGDFDQLAADVSVDHPVVVENYRAAHDIALRHSRGQASTEDLRKAMVYYRLLFNELTGGSLPTEIIPERKEARA